MIKRYISIIVILYLILMLTGCVVTPGISYTSETESGIITSGTFTGSMVEVESRNGGITIVPWDKNYVEVEYEKKAQSNSKDKLQEYLDNSTIEIKESDEKVTIKTQTPNIRNGSVSIKMEVYVPRELDLHLKTSNGSITFDEGMVGSANIETSNGSIDIVDYDGKLEMRTSNGSINVIGHRGSINARTSNGTITYDTDYPTGDVGLRTSNGRINMYLEDLLGENYEAKTSNGSINVMLPEQTAFDIDARSRSGRVSCDFSSKKDKRIRESINGGGPGLTLETSNGTITIKQGN